MSDQTRPTLREQGMKYEHGIGPMLKLQEMTANGYEGFDYLKPYELGLLLKECFAALRTCQTCGGSGETVVGNPGIPNTGNFVTDECPNPDCVDGKDYVAALEALGLKSRPYYTFRWALVVEEADE